MNYYNEIKQELFRNKSNKRYLNSLEHSVFKDNYCNILDYLKS